MTPMTRNLIFTAFMLVMGFVAYRSPAGQAVKANWMLTRALDGMPMKRVKARDIGAGVVSLELPKGAAQIKDARTSALYYRIDQNVVVSKKKRHLALDVWGLPIGISGAADRGQQVGTTLPPPQDLSIGGKKFKTLRTKPPLGGGPYAGRWAGFYEFEGRGPDVFALAIYYLAGADTDANSALVERILSSVIVEEIG